MQKFKRIFLIVLDSLGAGELPDAEKFGDKGAHTLRSVSMSDKLFIPNLRRLGIGNIDGLGFLGTNESPEGAVCKLSERSNGKDSTIGHWEMSGIISPNPLPTFPYGFPAEILDQFSEITGRGVLCNKPYSGTKVIADYGEEHMQTGSLIVYTSADSVFQIAAHEDVVPLEELYTYCRQARGILTGKYGVGRVIARPFTGEPGSSKTPDATLFQSARFRIFLRDADLPKPTRPQAMLMECLSRQKLPERILMDCAMSIW